MNPKFNEDKCRATCDICWGDGGQQWPCARAAGIRSRSPTASERAEYQPSAFDAALIAAAEKHATAYDDDDREQIKTDVLNAFFAGATWLARSRLAAATPVVPPSDDTKRLAFLNSREGRSHDLLRSIVYSTLDGYRGWIDRGMAGAASPSPRTPEQPEQPSVHPVVPSVTRPAAVDDGRDTRALSELAWTVHLPPDETCHYHHTSADTPFGRFLITWKGWKEHDDPTIDETPWGEFEGAFYSVEEAQKAAAEMWRAKVLSCLAASPQPIDGEPV